jgi:hypothetical protein
MPTHSRLTVPVLVAGALLGATGIAMSAGPATEHAQRIEQTLQTPGGNSIVITSEGGAAKAFSVAGNNRTPLRDGTYKLTNGGSIKVRNGKVVWDAFGAIEKMKRGGMLTSSDPIG